MFLLNTSQLTKEQISDLQVDRAEEEEECLELLVKKNENIIIYGERGVGKSFLMRLLEIQLKESYKDHLPIYLNMVGLFSRISKSTELTDYGIEKFPKMILLEMCRTVWVDLLGLKYSDLRKDILKEPKIFEKELHRKIKDIFNILVTDNRSFFNKKGVGFGINLPITGESTSEYQYGWTEKNIMSFEFFEYLEEFKTDILSHFGINKVVIFCDESNHLSLLAQTELLSKYGELFSSRKIQMFFLADESQENKEFENLAKLNFDNIIHLKGFSSKKYVLKLIQVYTQKKINVSNDALDILFESFNGHPRYSLIALEHGVNLANKSGVETIDTKTMGLACISFLKG